ncbi:DUF4232 domain-containing protein [Streptomyces rimosus]|uniref:DUF4232 domain-containing protein n=1 Tax=Streptomyces rimosus TaxID=1927 RepID=UPI0037D42162
MSAHTSARRTLRVAAASTPQGQPGADTAAEAGRGGPSRAGSGSAAGKSAVGGGRCKFCRTNELAMGAVNGSPDQKTGDVTVRMTNKSTRTCSVTGFAGVDLKDIDGTSVPVHRGGEQPRITDLEPGDTATFSISYTVDFSGGSLVAPARTTRRSRSNRSAPPTDHREGKPG